MEVSRAGFYKWKSRGRTDRDSYREEAIRAVSSVHEEHPSHGYRWVAAYIVENKAEFNIDSISANYCYKCFRFLGIKSETRHRKRQTPSRKKRDPFPNLVFATWELLDRPRQVIVSDMTAFSWLWLYFEVTFYFDAFTKQILAWRVAERRGDRLQYIGGLQDVIALLEKEGISDPVILHTDQGSVYASMAYNELIKESVVVRSMSRAGKPTDNPTNESLNGWIKEELIVDFKLYEDVRERADFIALIQRYVAYYNAKRPCFSIGYRTPDGFYRDFMRGLVERKDTFASRTLDPTPKFVRERLSTSVNENGEVLSVLSTSENGDEEK